MIDNPQTGRRERYAAAIREADGWVLDDGQHMIDAVMAVADAELAARRAADLRDAEEICDEAGASYTAKALNEQADGAYSLMARFRRKAEEAEQTATPAVPVPPTTHAGDRAAVLRGAADALHERGKPVCVEEDGDCCWFDAVRELRRMAAEAQQQPDAETPTESVDYQVVGDWGVDGAETAAGARAAVAKWLRAYPKCGAYAQQRIVRDWPDGSEYYGPWTDLPPTGEAPQ